MYGPITAATATWNNFNVLVLSSALDRSIMSAQSFMKVTHTPTPPMSFHPCGSALPKFQCLPQWASQGESVFILDSFTVRFVPYLLTHAPPAQGLFPNKNVPTLTKYLPDGDQPVPVYSVAGKDNDDTLIRTYTKCPAFDAKIQQWYDSAEFKEMALATQSFRAYVGKLDGISSAAHADILSASPSDPFGLINWYNVWDQFQTYNRTGGEAGHPMPAAGEMASFVGDMAIPGTAGATSVPTAQNSVGTLMGQITWLAYWLETSKMQSKLVGPLFGGPLLADLSSRMDVAEGAFRMPSATTGRSPAFEPSASFERLVVISSHYNVQLGVLAALDLDSYLSTTSTSIAGSVPWITIPSKDLTGSVPTSAAVLAFELYQDSSQPEKQYAVRLVLQNGPGKSASSPNKYITVPLPCASASGEALAGKGACTSEDFRKLISGAVAKAGSISAWCDACGATTPLPCVAARAEAKAGFSVGGQSRNAVSTVFSSFFLSILALAAVSI